VCLCVCTCVCVCVCVRACVCVCVCESVVYKTYICVYTHTYYVTISRTLSCARSFALSLSLSLSRARFLLPSLPLCDVKSVCARVQTFVYEAHAYICVRGALTVEQRGEGLAEHVLTILPLRAAPAQCFKLT
jgi:hypothetical protein